MPSGAPLLALLACLAVAALPATAAESCTATIEVTSCNGDQKPGVRVEAVVADEVLAAKADEHGTVSFPVCGELIQEVRVYLDEDDEDMPPMTGEPLFVPSEDKPGTSKAKVVLC